MIGVGNEWRGDDAVGLVVARRLAALDPTLRVTAHGGEPVDLIDAWTGQDEVILVDAVESGARPGTIHRSRPRSATRAGAPGRGSTHALGVAEAVALGRALGAPPRAAPAVRDRGRPLRCGREPVARRGAGRGGAGPRAARPARRWSRGRSSVGVPEVAGRLELLDHLTLVALHLVEPELQVVPQRPSLPLRAAEGQQPAGEGVVPQVLL